MKHIKESSGGILAAGPYSLAVIHNGLVFVSGQLPVNPGTGEIEEGIEAQTRQCFKNLEDVLDTAGSSFSKILKITLYLADMKDFGEVNRIYSENFSGNPPARSCIESGIPKGARIEVDAVAST